MRDIAIEHKHITGREAHNYVAACRLIAHNEPRAMLHPDNHRARLPCQLLDCSRVVVPVQLLLLTAGEAVESVERCARPPLHFSCLI